MTAHELVGAHCYEEIAPDPYGHQWILYNQYLDHWEDMACGQGSFTTCGEGEYGGCFIPGGTEAQCCATCGCWGQNIC